MNIFCPNFCNKMLKFFNSKDLTNIASFEDFYVCGVPVLYFVNCEYFCMIELFYFLTKARINHRRCSIKKLVLNFFSNSQENNRAKVSFLIKLLA